MSLVYNSSHIQALSRKKKKMETQTPTLVKIDLVKLIRTRIMPSKGTIFAIHCHYLISPLIMRGAYKDASYLKCRICSYGALLDCRIRKGPFPREIQKI